MELESDINYQEKGGIRIEMEPDIENEWNWNQILRENGIRHESQREWEDTSMRVLCGRGENVAKEVYIDTREGGRRDRPEKQCLDLQWSHGRRRHGGPLLSSTEKGHYSLSPQNLDSALQLL